MWLELHKLIFQIIRLIPKTTISTLGIMANRAGKDLYYDSTKLSDNALKLVAKHTEEKAREMANALSINQAKVH